MSRGAGFSIFMKTNLLSLDLSGPGVKGADASGLRQIWRDERSAQRVAVDGLRGAYGFDHGISFHRCLLSTKQP
jgi:hypothetical protein